MVELLIIGGVGYLLHRLFQQEELSHLELEKKRAELQAMLPPKPPQEQRGWFAPKPPKPKTRAELVRDAETLLAEELHFCQKLADPIARQAAETAAQVRFRQRLLAIMEITP